jgi:glucokinase
MKYYIGLDIGGTKIAAALVTQAGRVKHRVKTATPKKVKPKDIYTCMLKSIDGLLSSAKVRRSDLGGIGVGVPGIVNTMHGHIMAAPNLNLTGFPLNAELKRRFRVPVALTNDVNAGLLGESWQGAARGLNYVVGVFPGTGVGGAAIDRGQLILGVQGAATELGHMIIDVHGPLCHCGNYGCLEALCSRWAVERDVRALIKSGKRSVLTALTGGDLATIKSGLLKKALKKNDVVTKKVLVRVSHNLGKAAISLNHIFNPQAIVFGGGVIKACGYFMLPLIKKTVMADPFFKSFNSCRILQSKLGDDAVTLGAVYLVRNLQRR